MFAILLLYNLLAIRTAISALAIVDLGVAVFV